MLNFTKFKELTRLEQTFFGLPFVLSGAILPFSNLQFLQSLPEWAWVKWIWIIPAFLAARISGMSFNQLIDRHIDLKNPRTQNRLLPSGRASPSHAAIVAWTSLGFFLFFCFLINPLCFAFAPFIAFLLFIYSYMKRIHASCHFVLGLIHFMAPLMSWMAVTGSLHFAPVLLGLAAFFSMSGNDIIYAFQDYHFDCKNGLHSIPSKLGLRKSQQLSKVLHFLCVASLFSLGIVAKLPLIFYLGPAAVACVLAYFHWQIGLGRNGKEVLFFSASVLVSFSILVFILVGTLWRAL